MCPIISSGSNIIWNGVNLIYKDLDPDAYILEINTSLGTGASFTLPLPSGYTYNFTVNWGDNSVSTITAYNDSDITHTYGAHGTYRVVMKGTMQSLQFNNGVDRLKVTKLLNWGNTGLTSCSFMFYGCTNLTYVANPNLLTFNPNNGMTALFRNCTSMTSIPDKIFKYTSVSASHFTSAFRGCTGITTIPSGLFDRCSTVTNFTEVFMGCTGISAIPDDLFRYCTGAGTMTSTFSGCTGLHHLPENLFYYNGAVTNYSGTFNGCQNIILPSVIWDLSRVSVVTNISNFMVVSAVGYSATGTIQDIWNYVTPATRSGAFTNQTSITNYADIPADWK